MISVFAQFYLSLELNHSMESIQFGENRKQVAVKTRAMFEICFF